MHASRKPRGRIGVLYYQFALPIRYHRPVMTPRCSGSRRVASIYSVSVRANKSLKSIELFINNQLCPSNLERIGEQRLQATLNPSCDLFEAEPHQITFNLHYHRHLGPLSLPRKVQHINIGTSELISPGQGEDGERREWKKSCCGVDIIIRFSLRIIAPNVADHVFQQRDSTLQNDSKLPSMTEEIMLTCPRFRILVIGKTGVGKSSVINAAFGITNANVSDFNVGVSNIDTEIISGTNEQFVLRDSQGFETGEDDNFKIVKNFIESRSAMPDLKDKIHAICRRLCFGIPRAEGRILETGIEKLLRLENRTPIIAVFTKYDLLISRLKRNMAGSINLAENAKRDADAIVKKKCIEPLEETAGKEVANVTVSVINGYEYTLSNLVRLTFDLVKDKVAMEASVVTAIAQKVNPGVNIEGCIAVGRMRYWNGLASSTSFANKALEKCFDVIHPDVITVWSLDDPRRHLCSKEFKALITNLVDDLSQNNASDPKKTISVGMSMVGTIAGIVSTLGAAAAPIVIPIAGYFVLAKWVYDVYQQSHDTLRRLMAYIVDLTLVMQNVFWLVAIYRVPVSRRIVQLIFKAYKESIMMSDVHKEIQEHVEGQRVLDRLRRDSTLGKIIELLNGNRINTAEMFELKKDIGNVDLLGEDDECW